MSGGACGPRGDEGHRAELWPRIQAQSQWVCDQNVSRRRWERVGSLASGQVGPCLSFGHKGAGSTPNLGEKASALVLRSKALTPAG